MCHALQHHAEILSLQRQRGTPYQFGQRLRDIHQTISSIQLPGHIDRDFGEILKPLQQLIAATRHGRIGVSAGIDDQAHTIIVTGVFQLGNMHNHTERFTWQSMVRQPVRVTTALCQRPTDKRDSLIGMGKQIQYVQPDQFCTRTFVQVGSSGIGIDNAQRSAVEQ